jgi:hypothetical protein
MDRQRAFDLPRDSRDTLDSAAMLVCGRAMWRGRKKSASGSRNIRLGKNRWAPENQLDNCRADSRWIVGVTTDGFRYE